MERIARREVKYVGYFESDPIRCASDPIRIFLREHSEFLKSTKPRWSALTPSGSRKD